MSDNESLEEVEIPTKPAPKKERKKMQLTPEQRQQRLDILAKAREKANEKKKLMKDAGVLKGQVKAKLKQEENENLKMKVEENKKASQEEEENEIPHKPVIKKPVLKKKKKVVVYESDSSEEEIVYIRGQRPPKTKYINEPRPKYEWTAEEKEELRKQEIAERLRQRQEYDELTRLEDEQLKRQYKQKLNEIRLQTLKGFLIPNCNFKR